MASVLWAELLVQCMITVVDYDVPCSGSLRCWKALLQHAICIRASATILVYSSVATRVLRQHVREASAFQLLKFSELLGLTNKLCFHVQAVIGIQSAVRHTPN